MEWIHFLYTAFLAMLTFGSGHVVVACDRGHTTFYIIVLLALFHHYDGFSSLIGIFDIKLHQFC